MSDDKKKEQAPKGDQTLGESVSFARVPGVARSHDMTRERFFRAELDVAGGEARVYLLQPEQVVAMRQRLLRQGWDAAHKIGLPDKADADYLPRRGVLLKLVQCCARRPEGRPGLVFAGDDGHARLARIDDGHLVELARRIVEFGEFFKDPAPAA